MGKLRFISLASGSSGNCYFLGTGDYGILIDAGIGVRTIKKRFFEVGIPLKAIKAVFVTHDHVDHIKAAGTLGEKSFIPIYATQKIHEGIDRSYAVTQKLVTSKKFLEVGEKIKIEDFEIEAFPVSHDATDSVGYTVYYKEKRFTVATDLGYVCENSAPHISKANYLVLESNYDEEMLDNGHYPIFLKNRIKGNVGHLNNIDAADFLSENYQTGLQYVFLCHLSKDNNTPEIAYETMKDKMSKKGIKVGEDVFLKVLERNKIVISEF